MFTGRVDSKVLLTTCSAPIPYCHQSRALTHTHALASDPAPYEYRTGCKGAKDSPHKRDLVERRYVPDPSFWNRRDYTPIPHAVSPQLAIPGNPPRWAGNPVVREPTIDLLSCFLLRGEGPLGRWCCMRCFGYLHTISALLHDPGSSDSSLGCPFPSLISGSDEPGHRTGNGRTATLEWIVVAKHAFIP